MSETPPAVKQELQQAEIKVERLNSKAHTLPKEKHHQYQRERSRFLARVGTWRRERNPDVTVMKQNLAEGYNALESVWFRLATLDTAQKLS